MAGSRKRRGGGPLATALVLLVGGAVSTAALVSVLRNREALRVLFGGGFVPVAAALALSAAACAAGLLLLARCRRAPPDAWRPRLPVRGAAYLGVAAAAAYLAWLQPYRSVVALVCFGVAGGIAALFALAGGRGTARLPRTLVLSLDFGLAIACLLSVGGELTLRAVAARSASPLFAQPTESLLDFLARHRLRPEQAVPGSPVNSLGHLDQEWGARVPGVPRAATIGDSFSTGVVPHPYHFTTVAERHLGRGEVCNLGIAAIGPSAYLHLLITEALPLQPDVVVVNLFVGNDLAVETRRGAASGWIEPWLDAERLLIVQIPQRLLRKSAEVEGELRPVRAHAASEEELVRLYPWLADPLLELPAFTIEGFTRVERQRARESCLPDQPPDWQALFDCLLAMRRACGSTPFAVLLIPDEFQVEDAVWELVRTGPDGGRLDRDRPQRVLTTWLAEQGIPCLDLLPAMRRAPPLPDGRRHLYHLRDTHFNARGNAVAGEALAEFLRQWWG